MTAGPVCRPKNEAMINPMIKQEALTAAEAATTLLKLLNSRIAVSGGNTTRADIISAPSIRIPITTVTAVRSARMILYRPDLSPDAFAKASSKVTQNMRL